ncbi:MAG TPA: hypothetical protein VEA99_12185 [Gemmatimonadaceae bacterium]|nr:hypothetical protein [Gemmatimonadaceae bacterium]
MPLFAQWRAQREERRRATAYLDAVLREPSEEQVDWLAETATGGDRDHARWELRYARRALGLVAAERDALDDRTGSAVARAMAERLERDPGVDPEMKEVADRQFNARLMEYRLVVATRPGAPVTLRLGQMLLAFAGMPVGLGVADVAKAGEVMAGYLAEANDRLRDVYGAAALPEDVAPSSLPAR